MIMLGILFLLSLALSSFFSASEMAFVSSNKLKIRELAENNDLRAQRVMHLQKNSQNFLASILTGNNIVNITATSILAYFLERYCQVQNEWVVTAILAPVLIVFCEMVPKDYARMRAAPFLMKQVFWLQLFMKLFSFPVFLLFGSIRFLWPSFSNRQKEDLFVNEEEFRSLIEESARQGVVGEQEQKLIHTILDFERIQVQSVMIPVEQIPMVDLHSSVSDVKELARKSRSRMMLVYEEIPSIVVGMIYVFDLIRKGESAQGLHDFLRAPIFIPETISIEKAFFTLQQKRQSYAVVTDLLKNIKGVVPIERLLIFEKR